MQVSVRSRSWFWSGEEPVWIVVVTAVVALILGWALMTLVTTQTSGMSLDDLSLRYPADWMRDDKMAVEEGYSLYALGLSASQPRLAVGVLVELDPAAPVSLDELVAQRGFSQAAIKEMYRVLSSEQAKVGGKAGVAITYGYVKDSNNSPHLSSLPVVIEGVDYLVPHKGKVYMISLEVAAEDLQAQQKIFGRTLKSVRFR